MAKSKAEMEENIRCANHVLDAAENKILPLFYKEAAGIILVKADEFGCVVSGAGGIGVALSHNDGKWSAPIAVTFGTSGAGATLGYAKKDILIILNHFSQKKLLEGEHQLSVGLDTGFAVGPIGASAGSSVEVSEKGGLGSSFIYTFQKGVLLNIELTTGGVKIDKLATRDFYGTDNISDIMEGKVTIPAFEGIAELQNRLTALS